MRTMLGVCFSLSFILVSVNALEERVLPSAERDPALGAKLPEGVFWEAKKGWKFEKDQLVFFNANQNKNGNRYAVWREYHFEIGSNEVVVFDTRPFGTTLKTGRKQVDEKGRALSEKKVMDQLHDQAQDIREAREPRPVSIHEYPPYWFHGPFWYGGWHFQGRHCR